MPALRDLQESFVAGIIGGRHAVAELLIGARGGSGAAGLAVYRNNVRANYRKALRETYGAVLALIGEACFAQAVDAYVEAVPSTSGDLYDFGASFGAFLASHAPTRRLAYLPDVARLEWAVECAERAADAPPLDPAGLAAVAPERLADLRLALHPSARLLASPFPILRIWQVNQPGYDDDRTVDLRSGGVRLLVVRRDLAVEIEPLAVADFALLSALAAGRSLADALEAALALDADFGLFAALRRHIAAGTFTRFALPQG